MMARHVYIDDVNHVDGLRKFRFIDHNHTPHWKRLNNGRANLEVWTHAENPYLSFTCEETADTGRDRGTFSKKTMITMDAAEARQFYLWLKSHFEPNTEPRP